jgi:deazaflavin-dependent oxidoreductase (nitroreductase family)
MSDPLPYGPVLTRLAEPMRRAFLVVNRRVAAPALRRGGGVLLATPLAGSILLLTTTGRVSGERREVPLCYAVVDGAVVVVAGYGHAAQWYRNAVAHPEVEVTLPAAAFAGRAVEVVDDDARVRAMRVVAASMGVAGRSTLGDVAAMPDDEVLALARTLPMLAITPTAVLPGPFDPGGAATRAVLAAWLALPLVPLVPLVGRAVRAWRRRG